MNQYGVDIIVPFLYWDNILRRENVSAFLIQNEEYWAAPCIGLFDRMNPCDNSLGIFDLDESHPVPVIRMVFALASKTPSVTVIHPPKEYSPRKEFFKEDKYTTLDTWCRKASLETFRPIEVTGYTKGYSSILAFTKERGRDLSKTRPGICIQLPTCTTLTGSGLLDDLTNESRHILTDCGLKEI